MSFKFYCDCGQKVSATDDMIGTQAACPRCGALLTISPPAYAAPAASPEPVRSPPPTQAPPPILRRGEPIPPRPTALLSNLAAITVFALLGGAAWVLGDRFFDLIPAFIGAVIGLPVGAAIAAIFLRAAIRIVARFDLPFLETVYLCLLTGSLNLVSSLPAFALVKQPVLAKQVGMASNGTALLLSLACYAFLIRDDLGRPIGWGKGILSYLMNLVLIVAFFGLLGGLGYLLWRMA